MLFRSVKAIEYWLKERVAGHGELERAAEFIHFACTSEDINNLAYALMLAEARDWVILPAIEIIGDLVEPTTGAVAVNGKTAHQARLDRDYGIVFQHAVLYDWRTVHRNIALPLEMLGWSRSSRNARVAEMLELVELTGFAHHHPWQLSGGMQQRVAIARSLASNPPLLLMDEPSEGLAPVIVQALDRMIRTMKQKGYTVVMVEQNFRFAAPLADRHYVMEHGRIAQGFAAAELDSKMDMLHEYLGV